jgi:hypothetical protein
MSVGEAFMLSGQVYVMGAAIALGMAVLIKLICYIINRSDEKAAAKVQAADRKGGTAQ